MSFRRTLSLILFFAACAAAQMPPSAAVTLTPMPVVAGSPELIRVLSRDAASVTGEWLGHPLQFFPGKAKGEWFALAGADVEAPVGPSLLQITPHTPNPAADGISMKVRIQAAHYRSGVLRVAPRFVEPDQAALAEIREEAALKEKIFANTASEPLWKGSFRAPVHAAPTDSFGTRRTFNGKLASIHKGMDFRAPAGTPVRAGNDGVVVLARPLYYEGNCVVIDHGLGFYTLSMHLSRIDVREGQRVAAGQPLGLSGATGRVTGPHLHWAVRWQGAYLDPAKLLRLNLSAVK
jgi:hypothetical protein